MAEDAVMTEAAPNEAPAPETEMDGNGEQAGVAESIEGVTVEQWKGMSAVVSAVYGFREAEYVTYTITNTLRC